MALNQLTADQISQLEAGGTATSGGWTYFASIQPDLGGTVYPVLPGQTLTFDHSGQDNWVAPDANAGAAPSTVTIQATDYSGSGMVAPGTQWVTYDPNTGASQGVLFTQQRDDWNYDTLAMGLAAGFGVAFAAAAAGVAGAAAGADGVAAGGSPAAGGAVDPFTIGFTDTGTAGGALDTAYAGSGAITGATGAVGVDAAAAGSSFGSTLSGAASAAGSVLSSGAGRTLLGTVLTVLGAGSSGSTSPGRVTSPGTTTTGTGGTGTSSGGASGGSTNPGISGQATSGYGGGYGAPQAAGLLPAQQPPWLALGLGLVAVVLLAKAI